jgi:hypothetical protein
LPTTLLISTTFIYAAFPNRKTGLPLLLETLVWLQKGFAVAAGREAEPSGYAFANICEGWANANVSLGQGWGKDQDRHLFARVISTRPGRIVAVIGRED